MNFISKRELEALPISCLLRNKKLNISAYWGVILVGNDALFLDINFSIGFNDGYLSFLPTLRIAMLHS